MTADQSDAESALRALARDLVDELAAARAIELAGELPGHAEDVELSVFNVRPFTRQERTRTGRVITEAVRGHSASRTGPGTGDTIASGEHFVAGAPGHVIGNVTAAQWQAGQQQWEKRGQAAARLHEAIGATRDRMFGNGNRPRGPVQEHWLAHGSEAVQHLEQAREALRDQDHGEAYRHLAQAHDLGVQHLLSRADPDTKDEIRQHLDAVQGHMERLDKINGAKPDTTRKIVGTAAQQNERAQAVREAAGSALADAAETGNRQAVHQAAQQHRGLVQPEHVQAAHERAQQVAADKAAQEVYDKHGLRAGDRVRAGKAEGVLHGFDNGIGQVRQDNGATAQVPLEQLRPVQPEHPRGAAAVFPRAAQHVRATLPGGTISQFENLGRAVPVQAPAAEVHPAEAELARMKQQVARFAQREEQRRVSDLKGHVAEMKAADAAYRGVAPQGEYAPLTDEQFAAHKEFVAAQVERALRAGMATDQQYSLDGHGQVWSPQRAAHHAEILKDFLDRQVDVPVERQALFMGGLPGAGKTSTLRNHPDINLKHYAVLNPDDFKEELARRGLVPQVPGISPMEAAALVHEESAYLTDLAAAQMEARGKNVAWDVTMKNHDITAARVAQLKGKGYRVHAVFVDIPVEKSADRVMRRYRKGMEGYRAGTNPFGGRFIPRDVVLRGEDRPGHSRARATFEALKPQFASWELHSGEAKSATLVDRSGPPVPQGIPSVERLREMAAGATEAGARAAETGQEAKDVAGLTSANPESKVELEESESR